MPLIMAHRGARNLWAENSLLGFRKTLEAGFDAVEFDVHLSKAGELLVIHDATLARTTSQSGLVADLTPQSRRDLQLKNEYGSLIDEGVPSLEEVLDIFEAYPNARLYVELKSDINGHPYEGIVAKVADLLRARGMQNRACLHSFDINVVRKVAEIAPEFERLISVNQDWADRQGGLAQFLRDVDGLVDIVGIHHALFDAEFDYIRDHFGLERCSSWTLNDPDLIRKWIERGPKWLVSDNPILLRDLLNTPMQGNENV